MCIAVNRGCGIETPQHQNQHFPLQCDTDAVDLASQSQTGDASSRGRIKHQPKEFILIENRLIFSEMEYNIRKEPQLL